MSTRTPTRGRKHRTYGIYMPDDLRTRLQQAAAEDGRSANREFTYLLELALELREHQREREAELLKAS